MRLLDSRAYLITIQVPLPVIGHLNLYISPGYMLPFKSTEVFTVYIFFCSRNMIKEIGSKQQNNLDFSTADGTFFGPRTLL